MGCEFRTVAVLERGREGRSDGGKERRVEEGEVREGFPNDGLLDRELLLVRKRLVLI